MIGFADGSDRNAPAACKGGGDARPWCKLWRQLQRDFEAGLRASQTNVLAGLALGFVVVTLVSFAMALFGSKSGEVASVLASIIGGAIGAGGATLSVYYMLLWQREDESEKTSEAVLAEIAVLAKYLIGHLGLCELIQGGMKFPRASLKSVFVTPVPTIYPAVADRISRLARPTQVVNFYTRLLELDYLVALVVNAPHDDGDDGNCAPGHIKGIADLLSTQCQVAQAILDNVEPDAESEAILSQGMRRQMIGAIEQQLQQAKAIFPDADSFQEPSASS